MAQQWRKRVFDQVGTSFGVEATVNHPPDKSSHGGPPRAWAWHPAYQCHDNTVLTQHSRQLVPGG
ncbi:MAG TPA: hypothetical protein VKU87_00920, partial [Thermomicrobiaceae bacterium]|nr:hypothetical protein [Thermomicrobiaceae bacterium]